MPEYIKAWQCIGCGRIDGPQTCIGICQDRPAQFVAASEYDDATQRANAARERVDELEAFLRQVARVTPREGGWERSYRAVQARAENLLRERIDAGI